MKRHIFTFLTTAIPLLLLCCNNATQNNGVYNASSSNTDDSNTHDSTTMKYLPAVGDSATYIGTSRDREMKIEKRSLDADSKIDTTYIDTIYADTVIIKRTTATAIISFMRMHYFLSNFPRDQFKKVNQEFFAMDAFKFTENTAYRTSELSNTFYNDSLKTWEDDVDNVSGHEEVHKIFKGRKTGK
jgi:hypothetical protein